MFITDSFKVLNFAKIVAIVFICFFMSTFLTNCDRDKRFDDGKKEGKQEQVINQIEEDKKEERKLDEAKADIDEKKNEAIDAIIDIREEAKKQSIAKKKAVDKKVDKVKKDNKLTPNEKDIQTAEIQIEALWDVFCSSKGSTCPKT